MSTPVPGLDVATEGDRAVLVWRRASLDALGPALGLLASAALAVLDLLGPEPAAAPFFALAALASVYLLLANLMNHTEILVGDGEIVVHTGPVPVDLGARARLAEISFFSVNRRIRLTRDRDRGLSGMILGGPSREQIEQTTNMPWSRVIVRWEVVGVSLDGSEVRLVRGLPSHAIARAIADVLQAHVHGPRP